ncbi:hypothetical protein AgCh_024329 [Apium graveolens]
MDPGNLTFGQIVAPPYRSDQHGVDDSLSSGTRDSSPASVSHSSNSRSFPLESYKPRSSTAFIEGHDTRKLHDSSSFDKLTHGMMNERSDPSRTAHRISIERTQTFAASVSKGLDPLIADFSGPKVKVTFAWLLFAFGYLDKKGMIYLLRQAIHWLKRTESIELESTNPWNLVQMIDKELCLPLKTCKVEMQSGMPLTYPEAVLVKDPVSEFGQYCDTLLSNFVSLCSSSRSDPIGALLDFIFSTRKSGDHPYIVDPSLKHLTTKDLHNYWKVLLTFLFGFGC